MSSITLDFETFPNHNQVLAEFYKDEADVEATLVELDLDLKGLHEDPETAKKLALLEVYATWCRAKRGHDFLPVLCHDIVSASIIVNTGSETMISAMAVSGDVTERDIIVMLFDTLGGIVPTLVTWNGLGFDQLIMQNKGMQYGIPCPRYWKPGYDDRFDDYRNKYHSRHIDLSYVLANHGSRYSLDKYAKLIGLEGKKGVGGDQVFAEMIKGNIKGISDYCTIDTIITYAIYLRYLLVQGNQNYDSLVQQLQVAIKNEVPNNKLIDKDFCVKLFKHLAINAH